MGKKYNYSSMYGMTVTSRVKFNKSGLLDARDKTFCFYDHIEEAEILYKILHGESYTDEEVEKLCNLLDTVEGAKE